MLSPARLSAAAEAAIGRPVAIEEAILRDALDPAACAEARRQTGSSSAEAMAAMLAGIEETLAEHDRWSEAAQTRETAAKAALLARARALSRTAKRRLSPKQRNIQPTAAKNAANLPRL
jgi:argininosuccinate lyase